MKRRTFIVEAAYMMDDDDTTAQLFELRVRATSAEHAETLASQKHREFNYFRAVSPAHLCTHT